jgi:UDP-glucose-4-epimerase GalE
VLVTGGAGYIGSHACKALKESGYLPVVYDNLSTGRKEAVQWGPLVVGDIHDAKKLAAALKKYRPKAVMHFAALISVGESVLDPQRYYANNVMGSLALLEAVRKAGIHCFIFSSSAAVYGIVKTNPAREDAPKQPINPYGETKLITEWFLTSYAKAYGLRSIAFRYFNAAGADPGGELGSYQKEPLNLIPIVIDFLHGKRKKLEVFGEDYDTPDGTAIRDYIHVSDVAEAHVKGLTYLLEGGTSLTINLGTGKGHSVLEVIRGMEKVSKRKIGFKMAGRREGDPAVLMADNRRAKKVLHWQPQHSSLMEILTTAWKWADKRNR